MEKAQKGVHVTKNAVTSENIAHKAFGFSARFLESEIKANLHRGRVEVGV